MMNDDLRRELLAMRSDDMRVRDELMAAGELGGPYVPRMEEVHKRNANRLRELIALHGWPGEDIAGKDGCESAWFVVPHSVGEPKFQLNALEMLQACIAEGRVPAWHAAYLQDRIALHEGRPQRYGTQWIDDPRDGRIRPWTLADPENVNAIRAEVGLDPLRPIPELGPELPAKEREEMEDDQRWWLQWLASKGWHSR
jgi:hypothetical protein